MGTRKQSNTIVEKQLREALDAAEEPEVRYHIRESMQLLHLDEEPEG